MSEELDSKFLSAAGNGNLEECKALLARGAYIHAENDEGQAIHAAAKNGHAELCRFLLEKGASVSYPGEYCYTPLHFAAAYGHEAVCRVLIENKADLGAGDVEGETPLMKATDLSVVMALLEGGVRMGPKCHSGETALHFCGRNNGSEDERVKIGLALIERGATVDAIDNVRETPLHKAALHGSLKVCEMLIQKGAERHFYSDEGNEPIHMAAESGHLAICQMLFDPEWDVDRVSKKGKTPMALAAANGHLDVCRFFMAHHANASFTPTISGRGYLTPFQSAVDQGHVELVRFFVVKCGEDLAQRTRDDRTLMDLACKSQEMRTALLSLKTEIEIYAGFAGVQPASDAPQRASGMAPL